MLGKERRLFENRVNYEIHYSRINGLKEGAPVNLSGVTVGSVESLTFPQDLRQKYIEIRIKVAGAVAPRIRTDTVAQIRTQGLLGDKFIDLSGGSIHSVPLPPDGLISSIEPTDYEALLGEGGDVVQIFTEVASSLKTILKSVEEGKGLLGELIASDKPAGWVETADNIRSASVSLNNILHSVERGEGIVGKLIRDRDAGRMMEDLKITLSQMREATHSLQETAGKIERGEGTLGTLIQDPDAGREILNNLRSSASNLEAVTRQFREGEGILQRLISDKAYADRVMGDLEQTTRDLALITGKIERGEGTIGGLVNDSQLYQDAKEILSNVKANWFYSIYQFFQNLIPSAG